jgi:murein DD-endopeptidase MepM/ murein hydrolase activator NlpD
VRPAGSRRAIGLGLLLQGLLLTHPGAATELHTVTSPARKTAHKPSAPADRPARKGTGAAQHRHLVGQTVHIVRAGDSISRIASRYGVSRKSLIDGNKLARREQLRVGQRLVVRGPHVAAGRHQVQLIDGVLEHGDLLYVRAGPRRVPTRLYMASPEVDGHAFDLAWPVDGQVISPFGKRHGGWHAGMDIKADAGAPIVAAAAGVVISSDEEPGYGHVIRIEHDSGFVTVYAHNLENLVAVGDRVSAGTIIASVGRSGRASTPHLHFEVRHEGIVYNPLHMLPPRDVIEVRADDAPDMPNALARAQGAHDEAGE